MGGGRDYVEEGRVCDNRDENRKGKGKTKRTRVRSVWVPNLRHEEKTLQQTGIEKKRKIPHIIQQNSTNNTLIINKYTPYICTAR